ncbi:MAG: transglycosylase SLT domain-containing protein [Bacteroidales bacterium]|nr:transglycosylase SLT domain-containing protein [Bacteroidales bacterium]
MKIRQENRSAVIAAAVTAVLVILSGLATLLRPVQALREYDHLDCMIEFGDYDDTTSGLVTGYNYDLLQRFARQTGRTLTISLGPESESQIDSLRRDVVDLVVIPIHDLPDADSILISDPVDSLACWVVRQEDPHLLAQINEWIAAWTASAEHDSVSTRFLKTFNPFRRRSGTGYAGPYDGILRAWADSIGWDWRMLAAIVFQESQFRIDVQSRRGAAGLMQMMPATARAMQAGDLLDPEESIRTGARYLQRLSHRYSHAADRLERMKFTLAAYNAGEGRIQDCLTYAALKGVDDSRWENIAAIIPEMREDEVASLDTLRFGRFLGHETLAYVDRVLALYQEFCRICPQ